MRCSASDSEAVHRWSRTVAKALCVTVPGLQRIQIQKCVSQNAMPMKLPDKKLSNSAL